MPVRECAISAIIRATSGAPRLVSMVAVVRQHDPEFDAATVVVRESSGGNYQGLTITVTATSQAHLDDIYRALTGHPLTKYVL